MMIGPTLFTTTTVLLFTLATLLTISSCNSPPSGRQISRRQFIQRSDTYAVVPRIQVVSVALVALDGVLRLSAWSRTRA